MKKILLLFAAILISFQGFAQDPRLYENDWYFASGELNGVALEPPFPSFVTILTFTSVPPFEEILIDYVTCEETRGSTLIYDLTENIFNVQGSFGGLVGTCTYDFMADHLSVYYDDDLNAPKNPFNYMIIDDGSNLQLTIFNGNGDHVIYNNFQLSIVDFDVLTFNIYPNPVSEQLFIASENTQIENFRIYTISGKQLMEVSKVEDSVDVSSLSEGLYFIELNTLEGKSVQKFIKN